MSTRTPQLSPVQAWDDPSTQLLDDTWLLTIFAVLLATALPWFLSDFDIDFVGASWGVLALGVIHVALTTDVLRRMSLIWRKRALTLLHATGVVVIGFIWLHAGGVLNPLFLLAFALPVIGASFISRWQPYLTAALAVVVTIVMALIQAPQLRWYASGLGTVGAWLASVFGVESSAASTPFPGFYAPFGYYAVLLQVFAVLLFGCAVAAEYFHSVFERLRTNVMAARAAAERGQELWATLIEHLPVPAFLVDADTLRVIYASEHLAPGALTAGEAAAGHAFFDTVRFSYPDVVQTLIEGEGGIARLAMVRVADGLRAADVRVQHIPHQGRRLALVIISDVTEAMCVKAGLDMADHAALVVDSHGHVMGLNKPALGLFPGTNIGSNVSGLLPASVSGARWWQSGLTGKRKTHVEIRARVYQLTSSSVALPGEEDSLHVIAFLPVAKVRSEIDSRSTLPKPIEVEPP
jgi:hypothetical protein